MSTATLKCNDSEDDDNLDPSSWDSHDTSLPDSEPEATGPAPAERITVAAEQAVVQVVTEPVHSPIMSQSMPMAGYAASIAAFAAQ